jgi:hypothetical protein
MIVLITTQFLWRVVLELSAVSHCKHAMYQCRKISISGVGKGELIGALNGNVDADTSFYMSMYTQKHIARSKNFHIY